jgi:pyruvate dehydrogenase E1 component
MVEHLSDDELKKLPRGGHDYRKVYAAYKAATSTRAADGHPRQDDQGLRLGEGGRGQATPPTREEDERRRAAAFRDRFGIPISDEQRRRDAAVLPPGRGQRRDRSTCGAPQGARRLRCRSAHVARAARSCPATTLRGVLKGTGKQRGVDDDGVRPAAVEAAARQGDRRKRVVPIVPDEARTFGMDALFREVGIYSHARPALRAGRHATRCCITRSEDGQILEEGITEAGSMSSFIAAGTRTPRTAST